MGGANVGMDTQNLPLAINMTFVGMTVVFMALIVLSVVISLFARIFPQSKQNQ